MAKFKGVERPCVVCGVLFKSPQCQAHVKSCSNVCGNQLRGKSNSVTKIKLKCSFCGDEFESHPSHSERRRFCSRSCMHRDPVFKTEKGAIRVGDKNPAWKDAASRNVISASGRKYARQSPALERLKIANRRAAKLQATPKWASEALILAIYEECQLLSEETGIPHHVDHAVPLISDIVCGLHCEDNLQILPALDNLSKGNRHWPDMP